MAIRPSVDVFETKTQWYLYDNSYVLPISKPVAEQNNRVLCVRYDDEPPSMAFYSMYLSRVHPDNIQKNKKVKSPVLRKRNKLDLFNSIFK